MFLGRDRPAPKQSELWGAETGELHLLSSVFNSNLKVDLFSPNWACFDQLGVAVLAILGNLRSMNHRPRSAVEPPI